HYLGHTVSFASAVMWQSLADVVRTAAFFVPGALGVQEASYLVLGRLLAVPADAALALSLIGRARALIFGAPGLLAWPPPSAAAGRGGALWARRADRDGGRVTRLADAPWEALRAALRVGARMAERPARLLLRLDANRLLDLARRRAGVDEIEDTSFLGGLHRL